MNRFILISLFTFVTIILSCSEAPPPALFSAPQPENINDLSKFPNRLQGTYISVDDHSSLIIDEKIIKRMYDYQEKTHINDLDSNSILSGDTLINLNNNEKQLIKREGDSLVAQINSTDILFEINYDNVVRKFKGYYFLNKRYNKDGWEVKKLELSKGQLTISSLSSEQDIEALKTLTESVQDTVAAYKFSPSKKQFRKFIKDEGFRNSESFIKQK